MPIIKDVAQYAGVSVATVSRCINTPSKVLPETRNKVEEAMQVLRYRYNSLARGFVTRQTRILGVVVPTITDPVFAESLRGIQDTAEKKGYHIILGNTDYNGTKEQRLLRKLREQQVEGIVLTSSDLHGEALEELREDGFPCVLLYSKMTKGPLSSVGVDNVEGGRMAASYLLERGHRRIGMLAGSFNLSDRSLHRFQGFRDCLEEAGIGLDSKLVVETGFSLKDCNNTVARLMEHNPAPTALFCSNDLLAVGAMAGLRNIGLEVPGDVSIIGFDDTQFAASVTPALTTVRQPVYEMGKRGTSILLNMLEHGVSEIAHELLPLSLVVRESVAEAVQK
ncbi:MAG: LacI family DNA-binding transcriptional regulator [bacterium]